MNKWLKVLLVADFFIVIGMGMIAPIYAIFVEEIGGDILDASGTWAVFAFVSGILMYLIGRWEDKEKHYGKMLLSGYILRCLAFLGYYFVQTPTHLFGVQIVLGLSVAITNPSYDTLYSKYLQKGKWAQQWGAWEGMNMIGTAIAALVGGAIANYYGFKTLFIIMFLSGLVGALIVLTFIRKR